MLTMKIFFRHLVLCALPILFGAGAGYSFTTIQGSCGAMVGALFAAKCVGRQRQYQAKFQLAGAGVGTLQLCLDRKSTRLNSSHGYISYAVFCLKKKNKTLNPSENN